MSEGLRGAHPPALALHQQEGDEVFGLVRDVRELLLLKVPLTGQDVVQRLVVVVAQKRRQTAEPEQKGNGNGGQGKKEKLLTPSLCCVCIFAFVCVCVTTYSM